MSSHIKMMRRVFRFARPRVSPTHHFPKNPFAVRRPRVVQNGIGTGILCVASLAVNYLQFKKLMQHSMRDAVESDSLSLVKYALHVGANIDATTVGGANMLQVAIKNGNLNMCDFLMRRDINLLHRDNNGNTALHDSLRAGHIDIAKSLVKKNKEIATISNNNGFSPLYYTAMSNKFMITDKVNTILVLLGAGADINAQDNDGNTVLHHVCSSAESIGDIVLVRTLLEFGATPLANHNGDFPTSSVPQITKLLHSYKKN